MAYIYVAPGSSVACGDDTTRKKTVLNFVRPNYNLYVGKYTDNVLK
jgi:hypothetical protein